MRSNLVFAANFLLAFMYPGIATLWLLWAILLLTPDISVSDEADNLL